MFSKIDWVSYALKMGVCSLFQVIKEISTGLYVYKLTSMSPPKQCVTGKHLILHKALTKGII